MGATDGNLDAHIGTLEESGYLEVEKGFVRKKPRTRVRLSKQGLRAVEEYVGYSRGLVEGA